MSRSVVASQYGPPSVLALVEDPERPPGPGEAVVEVRAAGVNPADVKSYSGQWGADPAKLPIRLGYEASGVVTAVGSDAVGPAGQVRVGDEVIAFRVSGAYTDRLVARASALVPKPASLGWVPAAGLMLAGATATHTVVATSVTEGDTVVVHGASGGVGLMAVQLAVARGATGIGTAGARAPDLLRDLGVTPVAYGPGLADRVRSLAPSGVDAAIDTVGTDEAVDVSLELVGDRTRIASIAAFERGRAAGIRLLGGGAGADPGDDLRMAARTDLAESAGAGRLRVVVAAELPLEDAAEAHRLQQSSHSPGKIVLVV
jgi:NADPH:quinone reductase-like Zn-dependent oxidoreductase